MPLTTKGRKIMSAMKKQYGDKEGEKVFYASLNSGKIKGVEEKQAMDKQAMLQAAYEQGFQDRMAKYAQDQQVMDPREQLDIGGEAPAAEAVGDQVDGAPPSQALPDMSNQEGGGAAPAAGGGEAPAGPPNAPQPMVPNPQFETAHKDPRESAYKAIQRENMMLRQRLMSGMVGRPPVPPSMPQPPMQ